MTNTKMNKKRIVDVISNQFRGAAGYELNLDNPQTFNEKLQWLKVHYRDPLMTQCADKIAVRDYVKKKIGAKHLVKIIGVYEKAEDIDFDALPEKFALKVNNGSGKNIICTDKAQLDILKTKDTLESWLKPESSHYYFSYEWCYKNIKPKIICEEFIEEFNDDLKDYKFLCFNGNVEMLFVCSDRRNELKVDFFDLEWNRLPFIRHYPNSMKPLEKPKNFNEMVKIAEKLSKPFPFVRVDLYEINGEIMFGELTFYPGNGMERFSPIEWDYKIGSLLSLPERPQLRNAFNNLKWNTAKLLNTPVNNKLEYKLDASYNTASTL